MPLLTLPAHDIDLAGTSLDATLPMAWLEAELVDVELTPTADATFTSRLSRYGNDIIVRGRLRAEVTTPCARCLQPAALHVDTELSLVLKPAPKAAAVAPRRTVPHREARPTDNGVTEPRPATSGTHQRERKAPPEPEYEFDAAEADVDTYDGEIVVLDPFVREALLLEIPNFPLCSEACPGIGPATASSASVENGARIDPRLAPLAALRAKLSPGPAAPIRDTEGGLSSKPAVTPLPPRRPSKPPAEPSGPPAKIPSKKKKNKE